MYRIGNGWDTVLKDEFEKPYFKKLETFLDEEYEKETIYPPREDLFNALKRADFQDVKVVILGQDPYHQPGQAHGMCFSVKKGVRIPPSLINIYEEGELLKSLSSITFYYSDASGEKPSIEDPDDDNENNNNNNDISDMRLNILVLLLPAIGLILYLIFRDDQPEKAAEVACFALIGFIIEVVIGLFVLLFSNDSLVFN